MTHIFKILSHTDLSWAPLLPIPPLLNILLVQHRFKRIDNKEAHKHKESTVKHSTILSRLPKPLLWILKVWGFLWKSQYIWKASEKKPKRNIESTEFRSLRRHLQRNMGRNWLSSDHWCNEFSDFSRLCGTASGPITWNEQEPRTQAFLQ